MPRRGCAQLMDILSEDSEAIIGPSHSRGSFEAIIGRAVINHNHFERMVLWQDLVKGAADCALDVHRIIVERYDDGDFAVIQFT